MSRRAPLVGIIMGSQSDWATLRHAAETLDRLDVPHEVRIVSAHRTPDRLRDYANGGARRGGCASSSPAPAGRRICRACAPPGRRCRCSACRWKAHALKGMDSAAFHRADAGRRPGRHAGDRPGRGGQRGAARGRHPGRHRRRRWPARLDAWRAAQTDVRSPTIRPHARHDRVPAAAQRHHRHRRRRPARADVGDGGRAARLSLPHPDPRARQPGRPGRRRRHARRLRGPGGAARLRAAASMSSASSSRTSAPRGLICWPRSSPVRPAPAVLRISQDRVAEKSFLNGAGVATAPWAPVETLRRAARRRWRASACPRC